MAPLAAAFQWLTLCFWHHSTPGSSLPVANLLPACHVGVHLQPSVAASGAPHTKVRVDATRERHGT